MLNLCAFLTAVQFRLWAFQLYRNNFNGWSLLYKPILSVKQAFESQCKQQIKKNWSARRWTDNHHNKLFRRRCVKPFKQNIIVGKNHRRDERKTSPLDTLYRIVYVQGRGIQWVPSAVLWWSDSHAPAPLKSRLVYFCWSFLHSPGRLWRALRECKYDAVGMCRWTQSECKRTHQNTTWPRAALLPSITVSSHNVCPRVNLNRESPAVWLWVTQIRSETFLSCLLLKGKNTDENSLLWLHLTQKLSRYGKKTENHCGNRARHPIIVSVICSQQRSAWCLKHL